MVCVAAPDGTVVEFLSLLNPLKESPFFVLDQTSTVMYEKEHNHREDVYYKPTKWLMVMCSLGGI